MSNGEFRGEVIVKWLAEAGADRKMVLEQDFSFIDPRGSEWPVPSGEWTDGASIPRAVWSVVGCPFTGQYRRAAVVHDYYCRQKSRPWLDVHRMFYYASRAGGLSEASAKMMYAGLLLGGPKWEHPDNFADHVDIKTNVRLLLGEAEILKPQLQRFADVSISLAQIEADCLGSS